MATLNVDIPRIYALLRAEYLYDCAEHHGEFVRCCVFALASIPGRALGFHCLLNNGAVIWRLPLCAFVHSKTAPFLAISMHQLWDCMSSRVVVNCFERLQHLRCDVLLKNKQSAPGRYLFTIDWHGSADSEDAGEGGHKCAHLIALDNGLFVAQPNNRIRWLDAAFVTPFARRPDYKTNTHVWVCENGHKWATEDSDRMFYEVEDLQDK